MSLHSKVQAVSNSDDAAAFYLKLADDFEIRAYKTKSEVERSILLEEAVRYRRLMDEYAGDAEYRREELLCEYGPARIEAYLDAL